jgi:two-component system sensor histidine kinase PilS (NtrC family)
MIDSRRKDVRIEETQEQFRRLLLMRLLIGCVLLGAGLLILNGQSSTPLFPFVIILCGTIVMTPLFWAAVGSGSSAPVLVAMLTTTDIMLVTVMVHYTGGAYSQFALLYLLSIASASGFFQLRGTLAFSTIAAASYVGLFVLRWSGHLQPVGGGPVVWGLYGWLGHLPIVLNVLSFYLIGLVAGHLSVRVEIRQRLLETAAEELREARLDTDQILQSISSGLLTLDADGRIANFNRAGEQILRINAEAVVGRFPSEVFATHCPGLPAVLERSLQRREPLSRAELSAMRSDGTEFPMGLSISLLTREPAGDRQEIRGIVAIFQDLTESSRMEEELRRADRLAAIGELSAGIAHEIRNPLASISGAAQILGSELKTSGEEERLLRLVVREADRLNRFVGDFLAFARSGPRRVSLVPVPKLLHDVKWLILSQPKFPRGIAIEVRIDQGDYYIEADEEEIKRVFLNIAQNAIEAMGTAGRLTIDVTGTHVEGVERSDLVSIVFRDTGPGIEKAEIRNVFKPFVTRKKGGTGLGLAIAQRIVAEHRGEIRCESTPGEGAAFMVYLPGVVVPEENLVGSGTEG